MGSTKRLPSGGKRSRKLMRNKTAILVLSVLAALSVSIIVIPAFSGDDPARMPRRPALFGEVLDSNSLDANCCLRQQAGGADENGEENDVQLPGDPQRGWKVFFTKNCVKCHSIGGEGGTIGPDLGRSTSILTAGQLTGEMWNHVPKMVQKMEEEGIPFTELTHREMADIFAFLYFLRFLGEPGSADRGKLLLDSKGCGNCHAIKEEAGKTAPTLGKWGKYVNPVVWTQTMWNHATKMSEKLKEAGLNWPEFSNEELSDLLAYVGSVSSSDEKVYLNPGTPSRGKKTFESKSCAKCHAIGGKGGNVGPDLASPKSPKTFLELTSTMWNHLPRMLKTMDEMGIKADAPTAQEMADVISYLFTVQYMGARGDAEKGKQIFVDKSCIKCHAKDGQGGKTGPDLSYLKGRANPILMAYVRWGASHGGKMLEEITKMGIPWPYFKENEMTDLLEYLNK